jgi:hypothetical protein
MGLASKTDDTVWSDFAIFLNDVDLWGILIVFHLPGGAIGAEMVLPEVLGWVAMERMAVLSMTRTEVGETVLTRRWRRPR